MKKKRKVKAYEPKEKQPLLERLYKKMHNWFWLGVIYDHENPQADGRPTKKWCYKDCTGIDMRAEELIMIEMWLEGHKKI